ncbi:hypothetical protein J6590_070112 [Homalodisca vitripennis]|nr:hypothetical protein J6590_070112 [Homalodisca vitripennis]
MDSKYSFILVFVVCGLQSRDFTNAKTLIGPLILKLEKGIQRMIEDPREAYSDKLILDLLYYCRSLIKLSYMIDDRDESAKQIAKFLFKEGRPSFLESQLDSDILMSYLRWSEEDVKNLYFLFEKVKMLWVEFHKTYKRNIVWFV